MTTPIFFGGNYNITKVIKPDGTEAKQSLRVSHRELLRHPATTQPEFDLYIGQYVDYLMAAKIPHIFMGRQRFQDGMHAPLLILNDSVGRDCDEFKAKQQQDTSDQALDQLEQSYRKSATPATLVIKQTHQQDQYHFEIVV